MAITSQTASVGQTGLIRLQYASDQSNPTFYIYRDGRLVRQTNQRESVLRVDGATSPVFRVTDEPTEIYRRENDGRALVTWARSANTKTYTVQSYDGAQWVDEAVIPDVGSGRLQWTSGQLEDDATTQYRVVAKGFDENETVAASVSLLVQRTPDPPAQVTAINAVAQTLVVSAL